MRRRPSSTADVQGQADGLLKGAELNKQEVSKMGLSADDLKKKRDKFVSQNALQEKLKADQQQATWDLTAAKNELMKEMGKWISVLEGQYGKTTEKLQEFGVAPRMSRPHKGPREQK
ncbi:MAG: hypothetical protein AB1349_11360 [Elusimicrobiota bacterium]